MIGVVTSGFTSALDRQLASRGLTRDMGHPEWNLSFKPRLDENRILQLCIPKVCEQGRAAIDASVWGTSQRSTVFNRKAMPQEGDSPPWCFFVLVPPTPM